MTKYLAALFALALASAPYQALALTATGADKLTIGKPGSTADKIIQLGTGVQGKIKYDATDGKLKTANDGVTFKSIGTGSGGGSGGIELLKDNADFESGVFQNWTASAPGTISEDTGSSALFDLKSAHWVPTTSGQTYTSQAYAVPRGLWGGPCLASVFYTSAESTNFVTMQVLDGSNGALSPAVPMTRNVGAAAPLYVPFQCPSSGSAKIQFASTGVASALVLDNAHLGSENRTAQVNQSSVWAYANIPSASGCEWASNTNATYGSFSADSDCSLPAGANLAGHASAAATKIPAFLMNAVPAGEYEISVSGAFLKNTVGGGCSYALYDGTTLVKVGSLYGSSTQSGNLTLVGRLSYSSDQSPKTIEIQATGNGGAADCRIENDSTVENLTFIVKRFPSASQMVTQNSGQAASWSGAITGATYTSNSPTYVDPSVSGTPVLVQYQNTNFGSVSLAPSGLGLSFSVPALAVYEFCYGSSLNAGTGISSFKLIDGASNKLTEIALAPTTGQSVATGMQCGYLNATSFSNTVKIQASQSSSNSTILGSDSTTVNFTIKQLSAGQAAVAYPTVLSNAGAGRDNYVRFHIANCTSDPCTIDSQSGGVTVVNRGSNGHYTAHFAANLFSGDPHCFWATSDGNGAAVSGEIPPTSLQAGFTSFNSTTGTSGDATYGVAGLCIGPK